MFFLDFAEVQSWNMGSKWFKWMDFSTQTLTRNSSLLMYISLVHSLPTTTIATPSLPIYPLFSEYHYKIYYGPHPIHNFSHCQSVITFAYVSLHTKKTYNSTRRVFGTLSNIKMELFAKIINS